jgi:hypothetical protein
MSFTQRRTRSGCAAHARTPGTTPENVETAPAAAALSSVLLVVMRLPPSLFVQ